jgi:hypothetical protein
LLHQHASHKQCCKPANTLMCMHACIQAADSKAGKRSCWHKHRRTPGKAAQQGHTNKQHPNASNAARTCKTRRGQVSTACCNQAQQDKQRTANACKRHTANACKQRGLLIHPTRLAGCVSGLGTLRNYAFVLGRHASGTAFIRHGMQCSKAIGVNASHGAMPVFMHSCIQ